MSYMTLMFGLVAGASLGAIALAILSPEVRSDGSSEGREN